jgi:hypothetical protein
MTGRGEVRAVDDLPTARAPAAGAADPIPTMSPDNTGAAGPLADPVESRIINQIQEGMRVVDVNGEDLGKVDHIKMGDPDAATVERDVYGGPGDLIAAFVGEGEPDVPEPLRSRLLRHGYVKIDGKGWIDTDRYVTADAIGGVSGDTVTLTVNKDRLLTEM